MSIDKPVVIPVTGVKLDKTSLTLQETDSDTLTATVEPADAANKGLTWQWQISRDDGTTWVDIDGATGSSYMIQAVTMDMDGNQYRCTVKGADGNSVTSNAATLTVAPAIHRDSGKLSETAPRLHLQPLLWRNDDYPDRLRRRRLSPGTVGSCFR